MVSRVYLLSTLRTIRRSLGRFLAIFTIVALGVGFLSGLLASAPDMRYSVQLYYADTEFMDLHIIGNLGLSQNDADAIAALDSVERVMPMHSRDLLAETQNGEETLAIRVHSADFSDYGSTINRGVLVDGRWPSAPDECVIEHEMGLLGGLNVGGTLTFTADNKELDDFLSVRQFTITGVISSSYYLNMSQRGSVSVGSGRLGGIAYLPVECFSADYYTDIFATLKGGADLTIYSAQYDSLSKAGADAVEALAETQKYVRRDDIRDDAEAALEEARQTLAEQSAEAERELQNARQELEDGELELSNADKKLEDGMREYNSGVSSLAASRRDFYAQLEENTAKIDESAELLQQAGEMLYDAWNRLHDSETEIEQNAAQLELGREELSEREAGLALAEAELAAGESALAAAADELSAQRRQLDSQAGSEFSQTEQYRTALAILEQSELEWRQQSDSLASSRAEVEAGRLRLEAAKLELEAAALELEAARGSLEQGRAELEAQSAEFDTELAALNEARAQLDEGELAATREFAAAQRRLDSAKAEIDDGYAEIEQNRAKLDEGWIEYLKASRVLDDRLTEARDEITKAEDMLRDIEEPKWYVLSRETNAGYVSYDNDSGKIAAIARVFPIFFFLVAALVASTTMTRMVDEERPHIGTLKALGYSGAAIASKYFIYAGAAALFGGVFGLMSGLRLFPGVIYNAYGMLYGLPPKAAANHALYGLLASGAIFAVIMLATFSALRGSLKECSASLMRPKAPKEGKRIFLERITPLWRRMKFTHKATARNLLRYKKRFFMTVIGVFGCTALLLCGFGLRDSVGDIVAMQFGEIFTYSLTAGIKHPDDHLTDRRISSVLEDSEFIYNYTAVSQQSVTVRARGESVEVTLTMPQDTSALTEYITFRDRTSKKAVMFDERSVLLSEKAASVLGVRPGDVLALETADGEMRDFTLTGIVENYVQGHIYMPAALYADAFGQPPEYLTLLAHSRDESVGVRDEISARLLASPNISGAGFVAEISEGFDEMLGTIDYIIVVITLSAGILAFVVMYNLTNINIAEREKELATIKVLGFTQLETAMYIFRETIILSLVGAATGLCGGVLLHKYIISTVEVDNMMFGRSIKPESFLYSFALTLVFSVAVNLVMSVKMRRISMAESLKAPE